MYIIYSKILYRISFIADYLSYGFIDQHYDVEYKRVESAWRILYLAVAVHNPPAKKAAMNQLLFLVWADSVIVKAEVVAVF
jgi:hypothetical protein